MGNESSPIRESEAEQGEVLQSRLYGLMSRPHEVREPFLHASYRNTGIDYKVIPDKIGGSG